jgi:hypothetical protein
VFRMDLRVVRFLLTAPYSKAMSSTGVSSTQAPVTSISTRLTTHPIHCPPPRRHATCMAVRVGLEVKDATAAFDARWQWCRPVCWNQRLFYLSRAKPRDNWLLHGRSYYV